MTSRKPLLSCLRTSIAQPITNPVNSECLYSSLIMSNHLITEIIVLTFYTNSLTSTILPATAAAAAVNGLTSIVRAFGP